MSAPSTPNDNFADLLSREVDAEVRFDRYSRALYSTDASIYQIEPLGVVIPRSTEAVQRTVQLCAEHRVPILPRGSGTSLSGQTVGPAVVIDFSKYLNRILDIDPDRRTARVQPGVVLDQLNAAAGEHGLQFGPDVATSDRANLGGMIGNNSAGARSILHGKTVDHVRALNVVLADGSATRFEALDAAKRAVAKLRPGLEGRAYQTVERAVRENRDEIVARYPKILRRVSGYNLDALVPECKQRLPVPPSVAELQERHRAEQPDDDFNLASLIVGSEGTLATVTEAELALVPLPPERGLLALHFDSIAHAVDAVGTILQCRPSAVELIDKLIIELAAKNLQYRHYLDFVVGSPETLLIVEFSGQRREEVIDRVEELESKLRGTPGLDHVVRALEAELRDHIWRCRKAGVPLLLSVPGARKPIAFVEDSAVAPERLPEFVARFRALLNKHGTDGAFYGHASVGCLHIRPLLDLQDRGDVDLLARISEEVSDLVVEFGGSMSGEHGDGLARSHWNEKLFGPKLYEAFREIKAAFDPRGIMNPGKIVDAPAPQENLRWPPDYRHPPSPPLSKGGMGGVTYFQFPERGGVAGAAEMCNGSGVCRKTASGTMCPSFMATREEEHTTRGRANALRLALTGTLPAAELTSRRMYDVLDLCLMCKACKAECPSNVDLAKLKAEFLAHYYAEHGVPKSVWLMAHAATINRLGSGLAPLSNWLMNLPGTGWLNQLLLGIDRRRRLPRFARNHFRKWFASHRRAGDRATTSSGDSATSPPQKVLLLDDCLTSYCEPQINRAAVELLEAAGCEVELAGLWCCGRPLISKGLLAEAQQLARQNIDRLLPTIEAGVPILGCEPSCLLTLVDEYPDLVPGDESRRMAESAFMVDGWLAQTLGERARRAVSESAREGEAPAEPAQQELRPPTRPLAHLPSPLPFNPLPTTALLHGHCQQRALVGTAGTRAALALIPGLEVHELDAGCCGMAGSFGYEKGHYEISLAIGNRVLFPAASAHDGPVIAPGFSCRHQVEHATGVLPMHPVELLRRALSTNRESA